MRVLLLSAYDAVSHQRWREALVAMLPEHDWTILSLPPRHFPWRVRGNAMSWAFGPERDLLDQPYDLLIATSMCDLAGLRAFVPNLARMPALVYVHENQFDYPERKARQKRLEPATMSLTTLLAADDIVFNSQYNRKTFLQGAHRLLKYMPDHRALSAIEQIEQRSDVMPVTLPEHCFVDSSPQPGPLRVVWNHRWEYDKAPERLLAALRPFRQQGGELRLALLGRRFRTIPEAIEQLRAEFADWLWVDGPVADDTQYRDILAQGDVVVSTALHDFQGLAVLEAMAAGCVACVPDRLAYPEFVPEEQRYQSFPESPEREAEMLARFLIDASERKSGGNLVQDALPTRLGCRQWVDSWRQRLAKLVS